MSKLRIGLQQQQIFIHQTELRSSQKVLKCLSYSTGIGRYGLYDCNKKTLVDCGALGLMMKAVFVQDKPDILLGK
jgi:hypothetical protein